MLFSRRHSSVYEQAFSTSTLQWSASKANVSLELSQIVVFGAILCQELSQAPCVPFDLHEDSAWQNTTNEECEGHRERKWSRSGLRAEAVTQGPCWIFSLNLVFEGQNILYSQAKQN